MNRSQCLTESTAPALGSYTTINCNQQGAELSIDDITVTIPPGAIPDGVTAHIEMGVALYGPFKLPDNHQPVSPILWFCIKGDIELLLPLEYKMPHVITDTCAKLTFAKADHRTSGGFIFELLNLSNSKFTPSKPLMNEHGYGSLSTKHCCYLCIIDKIEKDQALKKGYCLHTLIKKKDDSCYEVVVLCTYYLRTCSKVS